MGLRNLVSGIFPELSQGTAYIGSPEVPAGDWIDPALDQAEYRDFLEAARNRARGIVPAPDFVQPELPHIGQDKEK